MSLLVQGPHGGSMYKNKDVRAKSLFLTSCTQPLSSKYKLLLSFYVIHFLTAKYLAY